MMTIKNMVDGNEIIDSMELMGESKRHFMTFINACGYDNDNKEYKRLDFLLRKHSDIADWIKLFVESFESNIEMIVEATDQFKGFKIKKLNISKDDFISSSLMSLKNRLEELFQVECSNEELEKINQKLHSNELSLDFIYKKSKEDEWYNTAGKFARANWLH